VTVVAEEIEQQQAESVATEQRGLRATFRLPPTRIMFVPFSLVEVEFLPDDE
jgi:hypothetical protein